MRPADATLIEILASFAILANGVIYGTDVFGAIILRPAIAAVDDRPVIQPLGHVHPHRRSPLPEDRRLRPDPALVTTAAPPQAATR
jgi:hypothetical protein